MNSCSNCGMRIVPINGVGKLRCKYDLHAVDREHTCPSWEQTYIPKPKEQKRGAKSKAKKK